MTTAMNKYDEDLSYIKLSQYSNMGRPEASENTDYNEIIMKCIVEIGEGHLFKIKVDKGYVGFVNIVEKGMYEAETPYGALMGFISEENKKIKHVGHRLYKMEKIVTMELKSDEKGSYYYFVKAEKEPDKESRLKLSLRDNCKNSNLREVTSRETVKRILIDLVREYINCTGEKTDILSSIQRYTFKNCLNILVGKYYENNSYDSYVIATVQLKKGAVNFLPPNPGTKNAIKVKANEHHYFGVLWKKTEENPGIVWNDLLSRGHEDIINEINEGKIPPTIKEE